MYQRGAYLGEAMLNVPGRHNVSNATSVIALAMELGVDFPTVVAALESFRGARRRFEFKHRGLRYGVVDDYGHHPSEIRATLDTARAGHDGRIVAMFQPHRYTRTQALREEFGRAFQAADIVVVADVYPASETPIAGVSGQTIVDAAQRHGHTGAIYEPRFKHLAARVGAIIQPGDLLLSLGRGQHPRSGHPPGPGPVFTRRNAVGVAGQRIGPVVRASVQTYHLACRRSARFWVEPATEASFVDLIRIAHRHALPVS